MSERRSARVLLVATALLFVAYAHYFTHQIGDDTFIYFRYARNFAAGYGPVWNVGERVEGFSSPLWLLVLTGAARLHLPLEGFVRVAGPLLAGAAIAISHRIARALGASEVAAALGCFFCALVGSIHFWAPSGLEMAPYMLVLATEAYALVTGSATLWAVGTALVGLSRPEGPFMLLACLVAAFLARGRAFFRLRPLVLAVTAPVAYFVFRLVYFGVPFPNTYYAKATGALGPRLALGIDYVFWVGLVALGALTIAIVPLVREAKLGRLAPWRGSSQLGVLALVGAVLAVATLGGGDWMWGRRLLAPIVPLLFAVVAAQTTAWPWSLRPGARLALAAALMGLAINDDLPWIERQGIERWFTFDGAEDDVNDLPQFLAHRFGSPARAFAAAVTGHVMPGGDRQEGTMVEVSEDAARWIRAHGGDDVLVAVNHAGALPFYLPNPCLDMVGLTDAHIAREVHGGLHMKFDPAYVLARRPKFVVLNTRTLPGEGGVWYHEGYWEGETALVHEPTFQRDYRAIPAYFTWKYTGNKDRWIVLYERLPDASP